ARCAPPTTSCWPCSTDSWASAPDLLLLDVMMPGMDGPTTLARLRERPGTARTPVVFMTAKVQASEIEHYKALGALGVVTKPFDPMGLAAQVQALWAGAATSPGRSAGPA
ncbi:MAG: response regulator, partial [Comamonadaceae bacterium]